MPESESCFRLGEIIISGFQNTGLLHSTAMLRGAMDWPLALHAQVSHAALNVVAEIFLDYLIANELTEFVNELVTKHVPICSSTSKYFLQP